MLFQTTLVLRVANRNIIVTHVRLHHLKTRLRASTRTILRLRTVELWMLCCEFDGGVQVFVRYACTE